MSERNVSVQDRLAVLVSVGRASLAARDKAVADQVAQQEKERADQNRARWQRHVDALHAVMPAWAHEFVEVPTVSPSHAAGLRIVVPGDFVTITARDGGDGIRFFVYYDFAVEDSERGENPYCVCPAGHAAEFDEASYPDPFAAAVAFAGADAFANFLAARIKAIEKNEQHRIDKAKALVPVEVDYLARAKDGITDGNFTEAIAAALVDLAASLRVIVADM